MGKEELHFATCFSVKQTTENGKEVLRLAFCGVLRRNKHALNQKLLDHFRWSRDCTEYVQQAVKPLSSPRG